MGFKENVPGSRGLHRPPGGVEGQGAMPPEVEEMLSFRSLFSGAKKAPRIFCTFFLFFCGQLLLFIFFVKIFFSRKSAISLKRILPDNC